LEDDISSLLNKSGLAVSLTSRSTILTAKSSPLEDLDEFLLFSKTLKDGATSVRVYVDLHENNESEGQEEGKEEEEPEEEEQEDNSEEEKETYFVIEVDKTHKDLGTMCLACEKSPEANEFRVISARFDPKQASKNNIKQVENYFSRTQSTHFKNYVLPLIGLKEPEFLDLITKSFVKYNDFDLPKKFVDSLDTFFSDEK